MLVWGSRWPTWTRQGVVHASPLQARSCCLLKSSAGQAASASWERGGSRGSEARRGSPASCWGLQDDSCFRHQGGDWLPLVLCRMGPWAPTGIIILLSSLCSLTCLPAKSQVPAALEEDSQLKTTLTQMTFPLGEERVRARPTSRKPLKMCVFASLPDAGREWGQGHLGRIWTNPDRIH